MLRDLCRKIEILNNYCADPQGISQQIKETCIECSLALLSFLSGTIKFFRQDIVYMTPGE